MRVCGVDQQENVHFSQQTFNMRIRLARIEVEAYVQARGFNDETASNNGEVYICRLSNIDSKHISDALTPEPFTICLCQNSYGKLTIYS